MKTHRRFATVARLATAALFVATMLAAQVASSQGWSPRGNGSGGSGSGINAFTSTTASYVQPAVGSTVTIAVGNAGWMVPGQIIYVGAGSIGAGSPAFVQSRNQDLNALVTNQIAYSSNVTSGNLLVYEALRVVPGSSWTLTDTLTDTWTQAVLALGNGVGSSGVQIWYARAKSTGANTVTIGPGLPNIEAVIYEFSGFPNGASLDQVANDAAFVNSALSEGPITITAPNEVLVSPIFLQTTPATGGGVGWTALAPTAGGNLAQFLITTATGSYTATGTPSQGHVGAIASFAPTGSSSTTPGGYYSVVSASGNSATIQNLGYAVNVAPGQTIFAGAGVGPAGTAPANGGGTLQGIPATNSYTAPAQGTGTRWTSQRAVPANSVLLPSASSKDTGLWYASGGAACQTGTTEPAWSTGIGTSVTDGTCTLTAQGTQAVLPSSWQTALDCDFTSGSAQTLTTDGNYTVCGLTWVKANSANESAHASLGNGAGLNFQPTATTNYNGTTRTDPMLGINLASIVPSATWTMPLRVMLYESAGNQNTGGVQNNGQAILGIDGGDATRPMIGLTYWATLSAGSYNSTVSAIANGANNSHGSALWVNSSSVSNNHDFAGARIIELEFPQGFTALQWNGYLAAVPSVGAWPSQGNVTPFFVSYSGGYTAALVNTAVNLFWPWTSLPETSPTVISNMQVFVGANAEPMAGGTGQTGLSVTFNRMRVDYHP